MIKEIHGKRIKASNGIATMAVFVITDSGIESVYEVPTEKKEGIYGNIELRDEDGGVSDALRILHEEVAPRLIGVDTGDQIGIDKALKEIDGTKNWSRIGANTATGVSLAVFKAAATEKSLELYEHIRDVAGLEATGLIPNLLINIIDGGRNAEDGVMLEEHMIMPEAVSPERAYHIARVIKTSLEELIFSSSSSVEIGEGAGGGFVFPVSTPEEAFEFLSDAVHRAGVDEDISIIAGCRGSSTFTGDGYDVNGDSLSKGELLDIYRDLIKDYGVSGFSDAFNADDIESLRVLKEADNDLLIAGDENTASDMDRIKEAVEEGVINTVVIKPGWAGTVSDLFEVLKVSRNAGLKIIISNMTGETGETFIADLAYAYGCFALKGGGVDTEFGDAKYKRLAEISR